jgi:GNAT superfamily N-acetyltransferase
MPTSRPATSDTILVRAADWHADEVLIRHVRDNVFVGEPGIPAALDNDGNPVATSRLLADTSIGRMAVLANWRRMGAGRRLLTALLSMARQQGCPEVHLDAQTAVINFYLSQGFSPTGPVFSRAGIHHQHMQLPIKG